MQTRVSARNAEDAARPAYLLAAWDDDETMRLPSIDSEVASFAAKRTRANFPQLFPARVFPIVNRVVSRVAPQLAGCFVAVTVFLRSSYFCFAAS